MTTIIKPFPDGVDLSVFYPAHPNYADKWCGFELALDDEDIKDRAEKLAVALQKLLQENHPHMSLLSAYDAVCRDHTFPDSTTAEHVLDFLDSHWMYGGIDALRRHIGLPVRH